MKSYVVLGCRNLTRRRSRSLLTILGIVLAIGFTVGLLSISEGFMKSVDDVFNTAGPDLFMVPKNVSKMPFGMQGTATLDESMGKAIGAIRNVRVVEPLYMTFSTEGGGTGFGYPMSMVVGIPAKDFFVVRPTATIEKGRFIRDDDDKVVALGGVVAENVHKTVGDSIELISGEKLKIVGIFRKDNKPYDFFAYAPIKPIQKMFKQEGRVSSFLVKLDNPREAEKSAKLLTKVFSGMDTQTMDKMINDAKKMMGVARGIHMGVSCFALIIGVLFVACTMIMSVSERVREFATLRVIGASRGYVVRLIITESVLLSAVGGLLGCGFGTLLSGFINRLLAYSLGETFFKAFVSPRIFAIGFCIALLIGVLAGIFPAMMILKKNLSESLRYE